MSDAPGSQTGQRLSKKGLRRGQGHGVDDVDYAVRLLHIGDGHGGHVALTIPDHHLAVLGGDGKFATADRGDLVRAAIGLDHADDVTRHRIGRNDVADQGRDQLVLVLGLEQGLDGTGRQLGKGLIGRRKNGERACAL